MTLITQATKATQTTPKNELEIEKFSSSTQSNGNTEIQQEQEIYVSRVDPTVCLQEETSPQVEPPTMTTSLQLEASHTEVMDTVVATVEKATETEEDTPLFRRKLQKVLGVLFIAAATKKDRNLRPLINRVKKRDWDAIKASYGQYWFNTRNRLHVREDCLLVDERIVIPTKLRQTILESLHLTHPGSAAMLDLSEYVWFPPIHRTIVQMAQNWKQCTEQGKNLKPILGENSSFQTEPAVEPNEEVKLDFAGPLPDELNRDAYILVAIDKWSKFPTAKVVSNTTADIAIKFMQRYISNNRVLRRLRCDQAQTFRAKNSKPSVGQTT